MANRGRWQEWRSSFIDRASRGLGVGLIFAWGLMIVTQQPRPAFSSRFECGSDPWDILRVGELLEPSSLSFIVAAHCTNAKYSPDGWIELRYGGGRIDVEVQRVDIGDTAHFRIVSIGGVAAPQ